MQELFDKFINLHGHTDGSNYNFRDSIISVEDMIDTALKLGHSGVAITDHAVQSKHIKAILYLDKLRKQAKENVEKNPNDLSLRRWKEKVDSFKLILGCEIYLVNREEVDSARENNESTRFTHFILLAKNYEGYKQLSKLSSKGWENSFYHRGMERTPVYKEDLKEILESNKGNLIGSSACLGSEFAQLCLAFLATKSPMIQQKIMDFLQEMVNLFGDDFYIELQPSHGEEQIAYNEFALSLAKYYNIKTIITTDAHYQRPEYKETHTIFLRSQNAERETEDFYATTYLMEVAEMREYFDYMDLEDFNYCMKNTIEIGNKIEDYSLFKTTQVPKATIGLEDRYWKIPATINIDKYPYIRKYMTSDEIIDAILFQQIENGMERRGLEWTEEYLIRINRELGSLWEISEKLKQRLSSYYILTKEIVEIIWNISLVGTSRGSAGSFLICYLLEITQINPMIYGLDDWRHISADRPELPDIDIDSQAGERANILDLIKQKYGYDRVLNICTFKTEKTASAIQTIARGMGIDVNDAKYLSSLVVAEGTGTKTVKQCIEEYGKNSACTRFIDELKKVDEIFNGFIENIMRIEGLSVGRSIHASGVYIFPCHYTEMNSMMKSPNGVPTTQFDMGDSDMMGGLKVDMLTIEGLDRIRKTMDLLLKDNKIEWQGSLKETYDKYLHPDVLEYDNQEMWQLLYSGELINAFQFETNVGRSALLKVQPHNLQEVIVTNSLMRLSCEGTQPIDRFVRHKANIKLWYMEMRDHGLNEEEIEIMKEHLSKAYGVANTQEDIMRMSMDSRIANFTLVGANKLRKAVAKSKAKDSIESVRINFIESGLENGNRIELLNYVWDVQIVPMLGYAFSEPHVAGYSLILLQELNMAYKYTPLYWKVACLSVNAGNISEDVSKGADYGAIAKAIGDMPRGFVLPPCINQAEMQFIPLADKGKAMYSLNAINGIGDDVAKAIMENRPYLSFADFYQKCVETKLVTTAKVYNLIKAGAFDNLNADRRALMIDYVTRVTDEKTKLTTANIPKLFQFNLIPVEYREHYLLYSFRKTVFDKKNLRESINKSTGLYEIPSQVEKYYFENYDSIFEKAFAISEDGKYCLNNKEFDKIYKECIEPLTEWLESKDAVNRYNNYLRSENWTKYCGGSMMQWEMESICYYTNTHELEVIPLENYIKVSNFFELPKDPVVTETKKWKGRDFNIYKLDVIAGVVVEKNKNKSMITISTPQGCIDVKLDKGRFAHYDRTVEGDKSWLTRGNRLVIVGYRRGETFYPKTYNNSVYNHTIMKIEDYNTKEIKFKTERMFIKQD